MINKLFFLLMICLPFIGCQKKSNEYYLYHGLEEYDKIRFIDEEFVTGYGIQKIAFFQEAEQLQYVLILKSDVTPETVKQYSLGLHVYIDEKNSIDQNFLVWDTKPALQNIGGNKYIINSFKRPVKKMDSMVFFLYDKERYKGVIGNRIVIKNIGL